MAIVGRTEIRPFATTSRETYVAVVCRCLLCGKKNIYARNYLGNYLYDGANIAPFCDCYGDNLLEPVRIIPNDH